MFLCQGRSRSQVLNGRKAPEDRFGFFWLKHRTLARNRLGEVLDAMIRSLLIDLVVDEVSTPASHFGPCTAGVNVPFK